VVYLDEVAALGRRGLEGILLKPIDELPVIWFATAITVKKVDEQGRVKRTAGLSKPMRGRFSVKVGTALPGEEELTEWTRERCHAWQIAIDKEETVALLVKRSNRRVGHVIHVLARAASEDRVLSYDLVHRHSFDAD
jgi:hypothetical protein